LAVILRGDHRGHLVRTATEEVSMTVERKEVVADLPENVQREEEEGSEAEIAEASEAKIAVVLEAKTVGVSEASELAEASEANALAGDLVSRVKSNKEGEEDSVSRWRRVSLGCSLTKMGETEVALIGHRDERTTTTDAGASREGSGTVPRERTVDKTRLRRQSKVGKFKNGEDFKSVDSHEVGTLVVGAEIVAGLKGTVAGLTRTGTISRNEEEAAAALGGIKGAEALVAIKGAEALGATKALQTQHRKLLVCIQ